MSILNKVETAISEHNLAPAKSRLVVGVSGGADSLGLLYTLCHLQRRWDFNLTAVHLNHSIRAHSADRDERLVKQTAWCLGIPCICRKEDVPKRARRDKISLEMAARQARHEFFRQVCRRCKTRRVALAHNADDQAETFLLRLGRGAGLRGLGGMRYSSSLNGLYIIRPMLDVFHTEAIELLRSHRLKWHEDETNNDCRFLRNRVRHTLLPFLEKHLNPAFRETLLRTTEVLREDDEWLSSMAKVYYNSIISKGKKNVLLVDRMESYPLAARRRILQRWVVDNGVKPQAISFELIDRLDKLSRKSEGSHSIPVTKGVRVVNQYGKMRVVKSFERKKKKQLNLKLKINGTVWVPSRNVHIQAKDAKGVLHDTAKKIGGLPACASLSRARVANHPVYVRSVRTGDRIEPLGMKGSRKLQDIFVDEKIPRDQRSEIPVFECDGEVVWIPGYRISRKWRLRDPKNQKALHIFLER